MAELCPCGSTKEYSSCCEPLLKGEKIAVNPLELLRSRYTAHVKVTLIILSIQFCRLNAKNTELKVSENGLTVQNGLV